jgi:hypothetical protein
MILPGFRLYGKVDQVGNSCYVATKFFHVGLVPLIPLDSWVVLPDSVQDHEFFNEWRGKRIPLNWKSIFFAWLRLTLIIPAGAGLFLPWLSLFAHPPREFPQFVQWETRFILLGLSVLLWAMYFATYWLSRANQQRATELVKQIGLARRVTISELWPYWPN